MIKKITAIMLALITVFAMMSISMTSASAATKVIEISKFPSIYYGETLENSNLTPSHRLTTIRRRITRKYCQRMFLIVAAR